MALNRTETACWVTFNDFASSSCVWSSSSNAFNSLSSNFFGYPERGLSSTLKSPSLKRRNHSLHDLFSWCHHKLRQASMGFSRTFLPIKAENQNSRKCCLVNTKFDISNTVKIKVFIWNSKWYKLNIISRCLTSLKPPKSAVTMNHSQQLEPSLGKRTELICTPNTYIKNYNNLKTYVVHVQKG